MKKGCSKVRLGSSGTRARRRRTTIGLCIQRFNDITFRLSTAKYHLLAGSVQSHLFPTSYSVAEIDFNLLYKLLPRLIMLGS